MKLKCAFTLLVWILKLGDQKGGHFHSTRNWELRQSSEFSLCYVSTRIVCNVSAVGLLDHYDLCKLACGVKKWQIWRHVLGFVFELGKWVKQKNETGISVLNLHKTLCKASLRSLSGRHRGFQPYQVASYCARIPTQSSGTSQGLQQLSVWVKMIEQTLHLSVPVSQFIKWG